MNCNKDVNKDMTISNQNDNNKEGLYKKRLYASQNNNTTT